jgi:hypothetical protein
MATTISNPATFSSVRNAFNTEGYGTSTSFFAYRQGGGIVPATSAFNQIGAGTAGDPLQLSQFSNFTVPARLQTITAHTVNTSRDAVGAYVYNSSQATSEIYVSTDGKIYGRGSTQWTQSFVSASGFILIDNSDYWADLPPPNNPGTDPGPVILQSWLLGTGASDYSCRATILAGSTSPDGLKKFRYGTFGSWLAITENRSWAISVNSFMAFQESPPDVQSMELYFTLEFAKSNDLNTILGSATMTLLAAASSTDDQAPPI